MNDCVVFTVKVPGYKEFSINFPLSAPASLSHYDSEAKKEIGETESFEWRITGDEFFENKDSALIMAEKTVGRHLKFISESGEYKNHKE